MKDNNGQHFLNTFKAHPPYPSDAPRIAFAPESHDCVDTDSIADLNTCPTSLPTTSLAPTVDLGKDSSQVESQDDPSDEDEDVDEVDLDPPVGSRAVFLAMVADPVTFREPSFPPFRLFSMEML